jgi:hypothetical protein
VRAAARSRAGAGGLGSVSWARPGIKNRWVRPGEEEGLAESGEGDLVAEAVREKSTCR